jgi:hypothetical protein
MNPVVGGRLQLIRLCGEFRRDPNSVTISAYGQPADSQLLKSFEPAGADRVMVRLETGPDFQVLQYLDNIATKVLL